MIAEISTNSPDNPTQFSVSKTALITQEVDTKYGLMQLYLFPAKDTCGQTWVSVEIKPLDWGYRGRLTNYPLCFCKVAETTKLTSTSALEKTIEKEFGTFKPFKPKRTDFISQYFLYREQLNVN